MKRIVLSLLISLIWGVSFAELPEVFLHTTEGKVVNVATLTDAHKPLIISFFATWCKPCIQELKALDDLYGDWQEETGVEIYIVSIDQGQDSQKVKPMVDGFGWDYHVLLDPNGELKRAMNVQNVPHVFVIDSNGKTVYNHLSYTDGDELELRQYLK